MTIDWTFPWLMFATGALVMRAWLRNPAGRWIVPAIMLWDAVLVVGLMWWWKAARVNWWPSTHVAAWVLWAVCIIGAIAWLLLAMLAAAANPDVPPAQPDPPPSRENYVSAPRGGRTSYEYRGSRRGKQHGPS